MFSGEPIHGSFVHVTGGRLWVEQTGQGQAVVFVHAGIADLRMWDHQVTALAPSYHVIRYDQRGFGRSPAATQPYSFVADLHAVLDYAGVVQGTLVGSSLGGAVVIDYALTHAERVAALVTAAAGVSGFPWRPSPGQAELAAAITAGDADRVTQAAIRIWAPLHTDPVTDERIRSLLVDNLAGLTSLGTMWLDSQPAYGRLGSIGVPMLVTVGERDQDDFLRIADLLAAEITGARKVVLPDIDHNLPVRAATTFTELLIGFLSEIHPGLE